MSNILFYSQINDTVQRELRARAEAPINRTTKDLQFMLEKVANVEVIPYDSTNITADSEPIEQARLGGFKMREGSFNPTTENSIADQATSAITGTTPDPGFLDTPVYRTKPYIAGLSITTYDQSRGFLNKAALDIVIPDTGSDIDLMENIYCRPGRSLKLVIEHPESAVITEPNRLADDNMVDYSNLLTAYPNTTEDEIRKLNRVTFNGKITNFTLKYETDGSATLKVDIMGTTGTYINVSTYTGKTESDDPENNDANDNTKTDLNKFYTTLLRESNAKVDGIQAATLSTSKNIEIITDSNNTDQSILWGNYTSNINSNVQGTLHKFISVGYLVNEINKKLFSKLNDPTTDFTVELVCNDEFCKSNYRENIVSANPTRILLWPGTGGSKTNVYGDPNTTNTFTAYDSVEPITSGFLEGEVAYPSRIYINIEVISEIIDDTEKAAKKAKREANVRDLLNKISDEIALQTGGEINLKLVQHPLQEKILMFYDTNFIDPTISPTAEFQLPAYGLQGRSVTRELSITTQVPDSVKSMIYGVSASSKTFNAKAVYSPYAFATPDQRKKIAEDFEKNYNESIKALNKAKEDFQKQPSSPDQPGPSTTIVDNLQKALELYMSYPYADINETIASKIPAFPLEVSVTMDGINGFKYGDILNISGIPEKYQRTFVFMVIGITHNVSNDGDWSTQLQLKARIRVD